MIRETKQGTRGTQLGEGDIVPIVFQLLGNKSPYKREKLKRALTMSLLTNRVPFVPTVFWLFRLPFWPGIT